MSRGKQATRALAGLAGLTALVPASAQQTTAATQVAARTGAHSGIMYNARVRQHHLLSTPDFAHVRLCLPMPTRTRSTATVIAQQGFTGVLMSPSVQQNTRARQTVVVGESSAVDVVTSESSVSVRLRVPAGMAVFDTQVPVVFMKSRLARDRQEGKEWAAGIEGMG